MLFTPILGTALAAHAYAQACVRAHCANPTYSLLRARHAAQHQRDARPRITCGSNTTCLCTNANGASFAQCIDCAVGTDPSTLAQSAGEGVLSDHTSKCAIASLPSSSLMLSFASPAGSATPAPVVDQTNGGPRSPTIQHPLALLVDPGGLGGWAALGM
ncbi:hypothetical protein DFH09DRAFT_1293876 [Mycena vulgaris]|nr:hypothetical protein DFH09DRAFT_1293876 [Mycena vulgaris]